MKKIYNSPKIMLASEALPKQTIQLAGLRAITVMSIKQLITKK